MTYSPDIPEIYFKIIKIFPLVNWDDGIAITYGDTVHSKFPLRLDVASHEEIHTYQQKEIGPEKWWKEYLINKDFRLRMETEAYHYQGKFIKLAVKDGNARARLIHQLALDMSGVMYDNMCTYSQAIKILKTK